MRLKSSIRTTTNKLTCPRKQTESCPGKWESLLKYISLYETEEFDTNDDEQVNLVTAVPRDGHENKQIQHTCTKRKELSSADDPQTKHVTQPTAVCPCCLAPECRFRRELAGEGKEKLLWSLSAGMCILQKIT